VTPPIAVIIRIATPIHSTATELADQRTAFDPGRTVTVFETGSADLAGFAGAAAECADIETTVGAA
jgi:hypothetical protein